MIMLEGKEISSEDAEKVYRKVLRMYRLEDAENHVKDMLEKGSIFEKNIYYKYDELETFYEDIVDAYENAHDCNIAENDMYEEIIRNALA